MNLQHSSKACRAAGFMFLGLYGTPEGESLLKDAEALFEVNHQGYDLSLEEKMKYVYKFPDNLLGYSMLPSLKH